MSIRESDVQLYFSSIKQEAATYFDTYVRPDWIESMSFYTDTYTFKRKADWQSKLRDPIADNLVHRLSNFLTRLLIESGDRYYTVEHPNSLREIAYKELLGKILDLNNFPYVFNDGLKYGLVTSTSVFKVSYQYELLSTPSYDARTGEFSTRQDRLGRVRVYVLNPFDIRLDPYGDSYIIEEQILSLPQFVETGRMNNWVHIENVMRDHGTSSSLNTSEESSRKYAFPQVVLHHVYTRFLTDARGNVLDRDVYFIVANGKYVVFYGKNLLPDGRFPYVVGQPVRSLVGRYGRGYISRLRDVIRANIDSLNLILDAFVLSVLGIYEYDVNKIVKGMEHQFTASVVPGKFYPVTERGSISAIGNPTIPAMSTQMIFLLDKILQNRSYQTEFFMGLPTAKGRPTATEIGMKLRESSSFFADIASEIERSILQPLFELVLITELLYLDDPSHIDIHTGIGNVDAVKHLESLGFSERMEDVRKFKVKVGGLSEKIRKQANLEKIVQVLSVLGNMPSIVQAIDGKKLVERVFDALDMSPDELFNVSLFETPVAPTEGAVESVV